MKYTVLFVTFLSTIFCLVICIWQAVAGSPVTYAAESSGVVADRPIKDKWAVVIGIDKFADRSIPSLQFSSKDAKDFAQFLVEKGNFAKDHVKVLVNEQATEINVRDVVGDTWLPRQVQPDDLVLIFASSHGSPKELDVAQENFLVVYDSDPNKLFSTAIRLDDLSKTIKRRTGCDRVVLLLDACHSGAANTRDPLAPKAKNFDINSLAGEGQIIISSSDAEEISWESKRYQNGVFTHNLIDALQSAGQGTKVTQAYQNLKQKVEEEVKTDRSASQTPVMKSLWKGTEVALCAVPVQPRVSTQQQSEHTAQKDKQPAQEDKPSVQQEKLTAQKDKQGAQQGEQTAHSGKQNGAVPPASSTNVKDMPFDTLLACAERGEVKAQHELALRYDTGKGISKNASEAERWFLKAAEQGYVDSQYDLGLMYLDGRGVVQSDSAAFTWLKKAADQGDTDSATNLAYLYEQGKGVKQNPEEAYKWYKKAAEKGNLDAQSSLAYCYVNKTGVEQDFAEAFKWFQRAAQGKNLRGMTGVAWAYAQGKGTAQNNAEAFNWYKKAADQGDASAEAALGNLYEAGLGVDKNLESAKFWYKKAAAQGDENAAAQLKRLQNI